MKIMTRMAMIMMIVMVGGDNYDGDDNGDGNMVINMVIIWRW